PAGTGMSRRPDEPVRLTKIYTRGGDRGETSLGDGSRVSKLDPLVRAYGAVDELNSVVGWAQVEARDERLRRVQNDLFDLGADLAVPREDAEARRRGTRAQTAAPGRDWDGAKEPLEPLKSFVLPGGSETAARLHVARAVCRRAESVALWAAGERPVNPL